MAIMFHNVKSGERRLCKTEPMIAAHLNLSDRNPNAHQGQDMGWRISPQTKVRLENIISDPSAMQRVAVDFGIPTDDIRDTDVLNWISRQQDRTGVQETFSKKDFEREYENDMRRLRDEQAGRDVQIAREARSKGETVPQRILNEEKNAPAPTLPVDEPVTIDKMKRPQLDSYAVTVGIEKPESFSSIPKLIEAIKAKESEEV